MPLNINQIATVIREQITKYGTTTKVADRGVVVMVGDGVVMAQGISEVMLGEVVLIGKKSAPGLVLVLEEATCGIVLLTNDYHIKQNDIVVRTKKLATAPVGESLLGRVIDPQGKVLDGGADLQKTKDRLIERIAPGVITRKSVSRPLQTGIFAIDSLVPIGLGQRELIIGDRQLGKTALAIDTIINQKGKNVRCIYVAIGQKASIVATIIEKLKLNKSLEYTTVVVTTASDPATMQYLAPYTGITIAEEWMDQGKDVLIVYDDLSKHAVAYRTLSLLLRRPPGREAYPGDIFYLHSRLLERACCLNEKYGGGTITALPIIETQVGDISAYVPTNLISITDGQIFLNADQFNLGLRPAVDVGLSVSRVGSAAQLPYIKQVSAGLRLALAQYRELADFSKFSADLDAATKQKLDHGKKITILLQQPQFHPYSQTDQALFMIAIKHKMITWIPFNSLDKFKQELITHFTKYSGPQKLIKELITSQKLSSTLMQKISYEIAVVVQQLIAHIEEYQPTDHGTQEEWNAFAKKYPQSKNLSANRAS